MRLLKDLVGSISLILALVPLSCTLGQQLEKAAPVVALTDNPAKQEVEIRIDGDLFTKYIYEDALEKPVLFPIYTADGKMITRGYPRIPVAGERSDHPHHLGLWLNYGDVNGIDFWNNSSAIPAEKKSTYGEIRHQKIKSLDNNTLEVEALWKNHDSKVFLQEETSYRFSQREHTRIIDRTTTLKAETDVVFTDNKEGMLGIRLARALELPSDKPETFTDASGNPTEVKVLNNEGVMADYLSSSGVTGGEVWGTRGEWMRLAGKMEGEDVAVVIIDHPENPGYPTHWHARGYGLFAANPLGQHIFNKDLQLNLSLKKGESITFRYRILIHDGSLISAKQINSFMQEFTDK